MTLLLLNWIGFYYVKNFLTTILYQTLYLYCIFFDSCIFELIYIILIHIVLSIFQIYRETSSNLSQALTESFLDLFLINRLILPGKIQCFLYTFINEDLPETATQSVQVFFCLKIGCFISLLWDTQYHVVASRFVEEIIIIIKHFNLTILFVCFIGKTGCFIRFVFGHPVSCT